MSEQRKTAAELERAPSMDALFETPAWKETERKAAEAGRYWRETFQGDSEEIAWAKAEQSRPNPLHRGARNPPPWRRGHV